MDVTAPAASTVSGDLSRRLVDFANREINALIQLRGFLTGELSAASGRLESLLDSLDYLWAHLPVCAGREGERPPASDIAFLKMVRAETDPFLRLWSRLAADLG
jgi:hypothetical protein